MANYPYALPLVNPGFETGDRTGWDTRTGNGLFVYAAGSGAHSGLHYARTGSNEYVAGDQTVDLPSDVLEDVDAGLLEFEMRYWQSNYSGDGDAGGGYFIIYDGVGATGNIIGVGGNTLSDISQHPNWTERVAGMLLPPGARSVRLGVRGVRFTGTNNDTYVDDFSASLKLRDRAHTQIRLYQGGGTEDWVYVTGGPWQSQARSTIWFGSWPALYYSGAACESYRDILIPSEFLADIDAGNGNLELAYWAYGFSGDNDTQRIWCEALDGIGGSLGTILQNHATGLNAPNYGTPVRVMGAVPPGTRTIRYRFRVNRATGSNADGYGSYISLQLEATEGSGPPVGRRRHQAMMIG